MGERKGNAGKKGMNGLLAHPFPCENGLLSTLSGKGWTKGPFSGGSSSHCEPLRAFSTLLGHFGVISGSFGGILGAHLLSRKSAKSHGNGRPTVGPKCQKTQNLTPWLLCGVHFE